MDKDNQLGMARSHKRSLWEIYTRSISLLSVLGILVVFVLGIQDMVRLIKPQWMINSGLHEKYRSNESYTKFGALHKDLSVDEVSIQRQENYQKILRIEQRNAKQRLFQLGLVLAVIALLNAIVFRSHCWLMHRVDA